MANQSGNAQCPFCQLVANPEQTFDVHETEHFRAWLDINPRARGHTMIVPKEHLTGMDEIGEHVPEMFEMVRIVMEKAKNGLGADGVSVVLNEGEAGGQNLEHFYVQVFPRFEGEENAGAPAGAVFQPMEGLDESDLDDISSAMENADFAAGGKPSKGGAATNMIQSNREGGQQPPQSQQGGQRRQRSQGSPQRQQQRQQGQQGGGQRRQQQQPPQQQADRSADAEKDDEEDDEDEDERETWNGEQYSWGRDGAEFQ